MTAAAPLTLLSKAPTGITGLDELTEGGLPRGRPTLVCGTAGCGKTVLGLQFLVRGALDHGEHGVFVSFEESAEELAENVASVGWDLPGLADEGKVVVEHIRVDASEIQETGAYDLEALFIRLGAAIDEVGATRVVIDTLEVLFAALKDQGAVRSELQRLFRWLKARGMTAVITAERGDGTLTRHGLEEYVSDCVILLDHRVNEQISTRRLRVVKYRGSRHGTDETPFTIDEHGFRVLPLSSLRLAHEASDERVSTGVERLDAMLGGEGYYRGGSMLISGTPGSGKTTLAASFLDAGCGKGERGVLFAFEESPKQLLRNMASVGIDLTPHVDAGLLRIHSTRPGAHGLEGHLTTIIHAIDDHDPQLVVIDPISAFGATVDEREAMLTRLVDLLKSRQITTVCTTLTDSDIDASGLGISSVIDAWLKVGSIESNGERNRSLTVVKARGTNHSNQVREFTITGHGVEILDVYTGTGAMVMGSARLVREAEERQAQVRRSEQADLLRRRVARRQAVLEAQIAALRSELEAEVEAMTTESAAETRADDQRERDVAALGQTRKADS